MTLDEFKALFPQGQTPDLFVSALNAAWEEFSIVSPYVQAAFLGVVANETGAFTHIARENMNYSPGRARELFTKARQFPAECVDRCAKGAEAFANWIYADRGGNGDEASGDGWRFRGGGLIQLTFRPTYRACGEALGVDLVGNPDSIIQPDVSARAASWFIAEYKPFILPLFESDNEDDFLAGAKHVGWGDSVATSRRLTYRRRALQLFLGEAPDERPVLRVGTTGPWVVTLQKALSKWGGRLAPDGVLGPVTLRTVIEFQQDQNLALVDGVVGPATWAALKPFMDGAS